MIDLNNLYFFAQVVEHKGFAPASRALGIPKSKLSRRVAQLESELNVRLLQRSNRQFAVIDIGARLYEHSLNLLGEANAAMTTIDSIRNEPCGTIKLTCPIGLLYFHVNEMLSDFMIEYPKVSIQLEATNRRVSVLSEGIDLAIRVRTLPLEDSDLVYKVLSDRGQCLVASPSLIKQFGKPKEPSELSDWPTLSRNTPHEPHVWTLLNDTGQEHSISHQPRYITTDMMALYSAAKSGVGLVQLPELMVIDNLKDGSLVQVLPEWQLKRETIHVVFPSRKGMLPSVRALIDFLVERYKNIEEN